MKVGDKVRVLIAGFNDIGTIVGSNGDVFSVKFDSDWSFDFLAHQLELIPIAGAELPFSILDSPVDDWGELTSKSITEALDEAGKAGGTKRFNVGKIQTREIDPAFILGIGDVLTASRAKYDHFNWTKLPSKISTPYESMMRHILSFQQGENLDAETGKHHLLHAATNIMFILYHLEHNPEETDDRFFKKAEK